MYIKNYQGWKALNEQKSNDDLPSLVAKARETDSTIVKSNPAYNAVMDWMERGGPTKGKTTMNREDLVKQMKYWNGDLSGKIKKTTSSTNVELALAELLDDNNLEKLITNAGKAAGRAGSYGAKMDRELIKTSVEKILNKFKSIHRSGRQFGGKNEEGYSWVVYSHSKKDAPSKFLGIIPFMASEENIKKNYQGKDLDKSDALRFENWYNSLKDGGVENLIGYLEDTKYTKAAATSMTDEDKINILTSYKQKASKTKNNIEEALKISWRQTGVTQKDSVTTEEIPGEPVIVKSGPIFFPENQSVAKAFFKDDRADLTKGYENIIKDAIMKLKQSLPKGAEITKLEFGSVASTSVVPSDFNGDKKWTQEENKTLVKARAAKVSELAKKGFVDAGLSDKAVETQAILVPNNNGGGESALWDDKQRTKYSLEKRNSDPKVREAYEAVYGPYKYSGVIIELEYKLTTPTTETQETAAETVDGDWTSYITWYKQSTGDNIKRSFAKIKMPGFKLGKSSGQSFVGTKVSNMCPEF